MREQNADEPARKPRTVNRDAAYVRNIVADIVDRFPEWRDRCTRMHASVGRFGNKASILEQCASIRAELAEARADLLFALADAPQSIAGHSRVVDVQRALDSVDAALDQIERGCGL